MYDYITLRKKMNFFCLFKRIFILYRFKFSANTNLYYILCNSRFNIGTIRFPPLSIVHFRKSTTRGKSGLQIQQTKTFKYLEYLYTYLSYIVKPLRVGKGVFKVKYKPSTLVNKLCYHTYKSFSVLFLRKNKVFNKGRYSRNRQLYRTGVYWCLYLNIIAVYGLYAYFYKFYFNFGYIWWFSFGVIFFFFFSKFVKYFNYFSVQETVRWFWLFFRCK